MKKGFGTTKCGCCGRQIEKDWAYYSVIKRMKQRFRHRQYRTVFNLCEKCFETQIGWINT